MRKMVKQRKTEKFKIDSYFYEVNVFFEYNEDLTPDRKHLRRYNLQVRAGCVEGCA